MDEKISLKALEDYSDDYASKVTASFFSSKEKITGAEILKVCDVHQINLFIIRELLHVWKHELQKLRSPFFDYSAPQVAESLSKFQNLLSNHISISRENFQPLLKKAVHQTLFLILDPYDFYSETLDNGLGGQLKIEDLKNEVKYVKINNTPLQNLLKTLDEKKLSTISGNEAFALLDRILEEVNFTPEEIDAYVTKFSTITPLDVEKLYDKKTITIHTPPHVKSDIPKIEPEKKEIPKIEVKPVQPSIKTEPVKVEAVKEAPRKEEIKPQQVSASALIDQLPKSTQTSLVEDFQKRKKIKDILTINQKFMFTKILFNGDFELFSAAVDRLDELDNLSQANSYLTNNYPEWSKESEEYQEFIELVERRFA
ncbi:MAG: hypothetical protein HOP08_11340 [Cyclobacteriaceae bacterium]|nr:hypothetical protein [Cyclobacteriaceae bacterium]